MAYLSFLCICLMWGSSFILIDRASNALGPLAIGTCRLLGGATILTIIWAWQRPHVRIAPRDWLHVLFVAALANAWPFTTLPYVMSQANEHGYFGMMVALVPLVTIMASIPMLGVWPTQRQLIGVIGGLVCLAGVVEDGSQRGIPLSLLALALTVPTSYAIGNTYIKWKLEHIPPVQLTAMFLGMGGCLLLTLQLFPDFLKSAQLTGPEAPHDWPVALLSIAMLGVFSTGFAVLLFIRLVKYQGPLFAGMVTYVIPLVALAWGQFDEERLTPLQLAAMGGVLAMVALVQWGAAKTAPQAEPLG